jgi:hypothetical protein
MGQWGVKPPLPIELVASDVSNELMVFVDCSDLNSAAIPALRNSVHAWYNVGRVGGMSGEEIPPWRSGLFLQNKEPSLGQRIVFRFREVSVDPRSLSILENVIQFVHQTENGLEKVKIVTDLVLEYQKLRNEYPPVYEPIPFTFNYNATDRRVFVEIEFMEDESEELMDELCILISNWGKLCAVCGYANPDVTLLEGYIVLDDIDRFSDMLVLSMQRKRPSEFAFDALVNMLNVVHRRGIKLLEVRVL